MSKQDLSKKEEQAQRLKLVKLLQNQTFYLCDEKRHNARLCTASEFDAWASAFVDTITGLDREEWDVFERWRFINCLLGERILRMEEAEGGTILLVETEVFSSAESTQEVAS